MSNSPIDMKLSRRDIRSGPALLLTGFCLYLAMPPLSYYPAAWIALVPLLMRWSDIQSPREAWLEAATAFFVLYALSGYWILRHPFWESAAASLGAAVLLPLAQGVPFAAAIPFRRQFGAFAGVSALAAFSLTVELLLLHGPFALPWFLLGHTQAEALPFNQFADLTGVLGLSLWVWILNGTAWFVLRSRGIRRLVPAVLIIPVVAAPFWYSDYKLERRASYTVVPVAVVQPALTPRVWADAPPHRRISRLSHLSDSLLHTVHRPPKLMVWPETALPPVERNSYAQQVYADLHTWTEQEEMPLVTGAIRYPDPRSRGADRLRPFNSAFLFNGPAVDRYDKRQLVPFAEGVPGASYWEFLSRFAVDAGGVTGYQAGNEDGQLETDSIRFATQICFESLFGRLHRREVHRGSSFLVVLAQNGWWGKSAGPIQHRAFTRLRAIESRRAVVLATVSGGSSLIHADGSLGQQLGWMTPSAAVLQVPVHEEMTFYVKYGDWLGWLALLITAGLALIHVVNRRPWGFSL